MYIAKNNNSENYHQPMTDGHNQTVLTDQAITSETDEMDPAFNQQGPIDPEEEEDEEEEDDDFPAREDLEDEDYDLDEEDDLERDTDEEEFY